MAQPPVLRSIGQSGPDQMCTRRGGLTQVYRKGLSRGPAVCGAPWSASMDISQMRREHDPILVLRQFCSRTSQVVSDCLSRRSREIHRSSQGISWEWAHQWSQNTPPPADGWHSLDTVDVEGTQGLRICIELTLFGPGMMPP